MMQLKILENKSGNDIEDWQWGDIHQLHLGICSAVRLVIA